MVWWKYLFFAALLWRPIEAADDDDDGDLDDMDKEDSADSSKEYVVALTDSTFADYIKKNSKVLVEFYAPWCGHCKSLAPEYEAAAKALADRKLKTKLVKVDATVETKISNDHGVQGFPTLFYYADGVKSEYNGPRERAGIEQWCASREKDPVEVCDDESIALESNRFIIRAKVMKKSGKAVAVKKAMQKILTEEKAGKFYACYDYLAKGADEKKEATLVMTRKDAFEESDKEFKYKGSWNGAKVNKWITDTLYNPVGVYDQEWYNGATVESVGGKYVFGVASHSEKEMEEEDQKKYAKMMKVLAKKYKDVKFTVWGDKTDKSQIIGKLGGVAIFILSGGEGRPKKYVHMSDDISQESMEEYLKRFLDGKVKPTYKSAEEPKELLDSDGVAVLVGSTFEKIAYDSKKDVFVEFYAPWCGHCKKLVPEWAALAQKMKDLKLQDKVVIAKMDATENECEMEIGGFPKLVLFPAVKNSFKQQKEFKGGERTTKALFEYLAETAVNMEGLDSPEEKLDKKRFSMVDRELKKKKKKTEL